MKRRRLGRRPAVRRFVGIVAFLVGVALLTVVSACATAGRGGEDPVASDHSAVATVEFIGNVWPNGVRSDADFALYWDQVTPENGGKWGSVEPVRDEMRWTDLDNAYRVAQNLEISIRLHTLVWGQQQPPWLSALSEREQRDEIEEWFAALAARYRRFDFIDVVNEPLHAKPTYRNALGGDGETGWDWVITAFELAREYFPDAELHLNDYNILASRSETHLYVALVELLQRRGLIDGIGVQAHSLEQANDATIGSNLDRLAATGLPIYVTELDVNFSDDLRQAHRLRELVTLFAVHPAVRGITLWGYLEGRTWKENAYLLRADGTSRPGLEWLQSARDGAAVELSEYVGQPRVGDGRRIRIEAEEFDEAHGLEAAGSFIAYVDGGDWNAFETIEVAWPSLDGSYDLFVTFANAEGVGNIDYFEISR